MSKKQFRPDVVLLFIVTLLFFISISAFDPFISTYATELGIAPTVVGGIVGAAGLASLFTRLPVGILSDLFFKRKVFIQIGLLITIVPWTIAFIEPNATTLYIGKISDGLTGSTWVIYTVMFASYFRESETARAIAIIAVASPVGSLIGTTIGGLVTTNYGYASSFLVAVIAAAIAFILTLFLKEEKVSEVKIKFDKNILVEQFSDKSLWVLSVLSIITHMVLYGTRDTFTPLVAIDLGANPFIISWLANTHLILYGIAAALCGMFFYKRLGLVGTGALGFFLQGVIAILIPYAPNLTSLFILQGIAGIAFGLNLTVLLSLIIANTPAQKQTTRMGLFQSVYSFGIFFGPLIMGIMIESFSREFSFLIIGIFSCFAAVLTKVLIKPKMSENLVETNELST
ncbi:MFS transporter [Peribacillus muralis]|uniref:MFS transporter n=1 Tax=Peribacillus muralis TaxID=264697 RepID=UPI000710DB86|nr:MFS transporter [Peribacillus muralis]